MIRNIIINGRRTSIRLEVQFWDSIMEICNRESITLNTLCNTVDKHKKALGLTAALRVFVIYYFRSAGQTYRTFGMREDDPSGLSPTLSHALQTFEEKQHTKPSIKSSKPH